MIAPDCRKQTALLLTFIPIAGCRKNGSANDNRTRTPANYKPAGVISSKSGYGRTPSPNIDYNGDLNLSSPAGLRRTFDNIGLLMGGGRKTQRPVSREQPQATHVGIDFVAGGKSSAGAVTLQRISAHILRHTTPCFRL
jgi:hypothetical protein